MMNLDEEMKLQHTDQRFDELDDFMPMESLLHLIDPPMVMAQLKKCNCTKVLIIDDNNFNIFSLETLLSVQYKIDTNSGYNGQEAVDLVRERLENNQCRSCQNKNYELIFMDISMPIMDGYEASTKIRQLETQLNIPNTNRAFIHINMLIFNWKTQFYIQLVIVGLTAHSTETYINKCFKSGMSEFMVKPVENELMDKLLRDLNIIQIDFVPGTS